MTFCFILHHYSEHYDHLSYVTSDHKNTSSQIINWIVYNNVLNDPHWCVEREATLAALLNNIVKLLLGDRSLSDADFKMLICFLTL